MGQSSGFKQVFSRFRRGSAAKATPAATKLSSPSKPEPTGATPAKRLFSFSPLKAPFGPSSARKAAHLSTPEVANDLIPAAPVGSDASTIQVLIRVRPRNEREASMGGAICVHPTTSTSLRLGPPAEPHSFSFDHVAGEGATQAEVFTVAGQPIVENCLRGYNGCLLAYGQTGSGKTYSMLGGVSAENGAVVQNEQGGLIQRIFEHLFVTAREDEASGIRTQVSCSFLEIYNETISDLLIPASASGGGLALREDPKKGGGTYVEGLSEERVNNVQDVVALLRLGVRNRRVGETHMNERSSRSHSVFTAIVERRIPGPTPDTPEILLRSRLHLVDLAGSERQKTTGAAGERLKEASSINKSLSALGHVIMSLVDCQAGRARHVPYRDSKLTFLLQDSLGGNSKTVMIACVSPAAVNAAETLGTLRFADGAKRIKNRAVVNEDADGGVDALKSELKRLKAELSAALIKAGTGGGQPPQGGTTEGPIPFEVGSQDELPIPPSALKGTGGEGAHRALLSALRREEAAAGEITNLKAAMKALQELLTAKDADLQRTQMMLKLKESRLARYPPGARGNASQDLVQSLTAEIDLLKAKIESHPEVKRFAVENLHLSQEILKLRAMLGDGLQSGREIDALEAELASLRREMLGMAATTEAAQEDAAMARAELETLRTALKRDRASLRDAQAQVRTLKHTVNNGFELTSEVGLTKQEHEGLKLENDELRLTAAAAEGLRQEVDRMCAHAGGLESQCDGLKAALMEQENDAEELNYALQGAFEGLVDAWRDLEEVRWDLAVAEATLGEAHARAEADRLDYEVALERVKGTISEVMADKERERRLGDEARAQAAELCTALAAASEERDGVIEELIARDKELQAAEKALEETRKLEIETSKKLETSESRCAEVQKALHNKSTSLENARKELAKVEVEASELRDQGRRSSMELASLKERLEEGREEVKRLSTACAAANAALEEAQAALREADGARAELEFELSDRSASMVEAKEQLRAARQALRECKAAEEEARKRAAAEWERARKMEISLADARLAAQAASCGPLEKQRDLLLVRAELGDTKAALAAAKEEVASLATYVRKKDDELAQMRAEMAAEVSEAAHQVQELLAAQARAEAAEARAAEMQARLKTVGASVVGSTDDDRMEACVKC